MPGCGGSAASTNTRAPRTPASKTPQTRSAPSSQRALSIHVTQIGELPAPVQDPATATLADGRIVLLGGLDAADSSVDAVTLIDGAQATQAATLPNAQHDAQAARLGRDVYVFGGGQFSTYDHILRFDPANGSVARVGALPARASDVAVAASNTTAYIVGGYDGTRALDTVLAWRPGASPRVVGHLTVALRYAAVAFTGGRLIVAGGTTAAGASSSILSFNPATGAVTQIGTLPRPLTHASATELDGYVLIVGGRRQPSGEQTRAVYAVDPASGRVRLAGRLPQPLSDAAVVRVGGRVIVLGGQRPGATVGSILAIAAH